MNPPSEAAQRPVSWPVAALLPVASLACLLGVAAFTVASYGDELLWTFGEGVEVGSGIGTGVVGLVIGVLSTIVLRHPGHRVIGWALGATGLFWSLDGLSEAFVRYGLVSDHAVTGLTFAVWLLARFNALLPATIVVLPLLFPEGRFVRGAWGVASWACMGAMVLGAVAVMVAPWESSGANLPPNVDPDPTTIWALRDAADALVGGLQALTLLGLVVPIGVVVHRYRRSTGTERDQMRWLLWGALVTATIIVITLFLDFGVLTDAVFFLCITLVPVAMTIAVVNPRLVSIEELLGRTVVLAALAIVLVVVDFVVVAALTWALDDDMAQSQVVLVVLLVTVLLYSPLRQRLSRWLSRRSDPYDTVAGLASTLETTDDGGEQLAAVAEAVASAFGVGFVSVEVERSGGELLVATYGDRPDETRDLPISYRDARVGRLVLPARGLRSRLSRRDEELLGDLVRQAAVVARTSRLAEDLVSAREEERRRIRRDLHDGLGPALSGVVFQLESARLMVDKDPEVAKTQIAGVSAHVQDVVADVRRLVHDLRPPALDDRGLAGALRQQGEQLAPPATVVAGELGSLPAAVEVAAFRIASEAMTNVARHARATRCTVRLDVVDNALLVEVEDDGVGITPDARAGVGLVGLRERAAELGGRSEVVCPPTGGTVVRAWLPLRSLQ
ncbi:sensor histidine kinase [Nocardioides sp. SR21]|uniref:sensor histidine kinase n=1 Tax=Nocardioides sp. SR21 TaxID=2919501 RepID=UPI001FAB0BAF|nr:sensor histidine kinase [Nocardioides sp. SR21]